MRGNWRINAIQFARALVGMLVSAMTMGTMRSSPCWVLNRNPIDTNELAHGREVCVLGVLVGEGKIVLGCVGSVLRLRSLPLVRLGM